MKINKKNKKKQKIKTKKRNRKKMENFFFLLLLTHKIYWSERGILDLRVSGIPLGDAVC